MGFITDEWKGTEFFKINDFHHVEYLVGNAKQAVHFYKTAFGFKPIAYSGPETGVRTHVSYVLKNNQNIFIFTTPLSSKSEMSQWLNRHGDGIYDIAFSVEDAENAYESCLSRGAIGLKDNISYSDNDGVYKKYSIKTYGDTIHSFIEDDSYLDDWAPNFRSIDREDVFETENNSLVKIDHIVGNVEEGKMDEWKEYYENIFGFTNFVRFDDSDISTQYSSLRSIVMRSKNWKIKLPINEPASGIKKSQIEEYLDFNEGPGVQHVAILSNDIIDSITKLRKGGVEFLDTPDTYYENLSDRVQEVDEDIKVLQNLKILVDRDEEGYLLQLFTKPLEDRPTLFIEIIQRKGSRGFGQGNFQALFESIEKEQQLRGNL